MLIAAVMTAFAAGMLLGAAIAWDKAFLKGKAWGFELGFTARHCNGDDFEDRIRSQM
jgi:hypothetical protein